MATLAIPRDQPALPAGPAKKRLSPWQTWGLILIAPYVLVFWYSSSIQSVTACGWRGIRRAT